MTKKIIIKIGGSAAEQLTPAFLTQLSIGKHKTHKLPLFMAVAIVFLNSCRNYMNQLRKLMAFD